ncbi:MAG: hypothetical protein HYX50_04775 [Chloroflexi bacterium]|nr:hypothetical protein [Chloroflexota bacterium]
MKTKKSQNKKIHKQHAPAVLSQIPSCKAREVGSRFIQPEKVKLHETKSSGLVTTPPRPERSDAFRTVGEPRQQPPRNKTRIQSKFGR